MFFRHHIIGRFVFFLLVIGLLMAASRGLYRSGYQDGFVSGMVFTAENGEPAPETAAVPPAYGTWGAGRAAPFGAGPLGVMFCFGAGVFLLLLLFMGAITRHHFLRHGHHAHHRGRHGRFGPEKEPDDIFHEKRYV